MPRRTVGSYAIGGMSSLYFMFIFTVSNTIYARQRSLIKPFVSAHDGALTKPVKTLLDALKLAILDSETLAQVRQRNADLHAFSASLANSVTPRRALALGPRLHLDSWMHPPRVSSSNVYTYRCSSHSCLHCCSRNPDAVRHSYDS